MRLAVFLLDDFSLLAFSSLLEPVHAFNRNFSEEDIHLVLLGADSLVLSDSGVPVKCSALADCSSLEADLLVFVGNEKAVDPQLDARGIVNAVSEKISCHPFELGGVASGALLLARAGALNGFKASLLGRDIRQISQDFPKVNVSTDLFSLDDQRLSCRAGSAAMDMMIFYLGRRFGVEVAESLAKYFVQLRICSSEPVSIKQLTQAQSIEQPKLAEAIELMQSNLEEPLTTDDLSHHVQISRRQLERLFKKYLDNVPSRYYLQIRLEHARKLLQSSGHSVSEIALRCGFSSGAHFSTSYRSFFGISPKEERAVHQ